MAAVFLAGNISAKSLIKTVLMNCSLRKVILHSHFLPGGVFVNMLWWKHIAIVMYPAKTSQNLICDPTYKVCPDVSIFV